MKHYLFTFAIITLISACATQKKPVIPVPVILTEKTTVKDKITPVTVEGDSSNITALFECDSLNKVIMKQLNEVKGNNVNSNAEFKDGQFKYKTVYKDREVFIHGKDSITIKEVPVPVPYPVEIERPLTGWQWFQIWCGRILIGSAVLLILVIVGRMVLKI
jgi:hypothetical protein